MPAWRWANVPLPEPHLVGLGLGLLLHLWQPWPLPVGPFWYVMGSGFVVAGGLFGAWAVTAATHVDLSSPERIITRGPFARSRNPMYLAWTVLYLGVSFLVGSLWLLILFPAVLLVTHLAVIREERRLRHRFGEEYLRYAASVRRYL